MALADAHQLPKPPVYTCPHLCAGAHGRGETPVSIPNTEVKTPSAYGTSGFPGGRVGRCRHSIVGVNIINHSAEVVKLVDTSDSKSDDREVVGVRVPLSAPTHPIGCGFLHIPLQILPFRN